MLKKKPLTLFILILLIVGMACSTSITTEDLEQFLQSETATAEPVGQVEPSVQDEEEQESAAAEEPEGSNEPNAPAEITFDQVIEPPQALSLEPAGDYAALDANLTALYEQVSQGVVAIQTLSELGGGLGSGFVYNNDGYIVTNFHVVEGATDLEVDFPSGLKARGVVVGTDLDSDLAVIKVDVAPDYLIPLPLGDSDELKVGQSVVAIGNPFGLSGTMTLGIVSAKGRTLDSFRQSESGSFFSAGDIIQTDASINPGNSGGPLINLAGEVIGINRAIRTTGITEAGDPVNSGIGFAISVNIVKRVVPELIANGSFDYPYLGISARQELLLLELEALEITHYTGAYVIDVVAGGPADKAGLRGGDLTNITEVGLPAGGDLIIGVDDQPVRIFGELLSYLMTNKSPGEDIVLTIIRDGEEMEVTITLDKRP
jgi:S1-C subfamily serine protease